MNIRPRVAFQIFIEVKLVPSPRVEGLLEMVRASGDELETWEIKVRLAKSG